MKAMITGAMALAVILIACDPSRTTGPQDPGYKECGFSRDGLRDSCWSTVAARKFP